MEPRGLDAYNQRKPEKSQVYSYENEIGALPAPMQKIFKANKSAWKFVNEQAPRYKRTMIHWVLSAKKEETKLDRLQKLVDASFNKKRLL